MTSDPEASYVVAAQGATPTFGPVRTRYFQPGSQYDAKLLPAESLDQVYESAASPALVQRATLRTEAPGARGPTWMCSPKTESSPFGPMNERRRAQNPSPEAEPIFSISTRKHFPSSPGSGHSTRPRIVICNAAPEP